MKKAGSPSTKRPSAKKATAYKKPSTGKKASALKKRPAAKKATSRKGSAYSGHGSPIAASKASASAIRESLHVREVDRKIGFAALRSAGRSLSRH